MNSGVEFGAIGIATTELKRNLDVVEQGAIIYLSSAIRTVARLRRPCKVSKGGYPNSLVPGFKRPALAIS